MEEKFQTSSFIKGKFINKFRKIYISRRAEKMSGKGAAKVCEFEPWNHMVEGENHPTSHTLTKALKHAPHA